MNILGKKSDTIPLNIEKRNQNYIWKTSDNIHALLWGFRYLTKVIFEHFQCKFPYRVRSRTYMTAHSRNRTWNP